MTRNDIRAGSLYTLADELAARMSARRRIGWFDHCSDSPDRRAAMARAARVWFRVVRGTRMSAREARDF